VKRSEKASVPTSRDVKTLNEIAQEYGVHDVPVSTWKRELQDQASTLFEQKRGQKPVDPVDDPEKLYSEIGLLRMGLAWIKKKSGLSR